MEKLEKENEFINLQNLLVQVELVLDVLFMHDLSHLLAHCSQEFQRFDILPFYAMNVFENLSLQLHAAKDAFSVKIPDCIKLHVENSEKTFLVWKT